MNHFITRLGILFSFIGVAAFGVGVITAIYQGGVAGISFIVALIIGTVALSLDGLIRQPTSTNRTVTTSHPKHGYQIAH